MRQFILVIAAAALLAGDAAAQAPMLDSLASGALLRVRTNRLGRAEGRLRERRGDTLVLLSRKGDTLRVPRAELLHAEFSPIARRPVLKRTALGLLAGAAVGAAIGYARYDGGSLFFDTRAESAGFGALLGGAAGASVGVLVGMSMPVDVWQQVWPPPGAPRR